MSAILRRLMVVNWCDLPRWDIKTGRASAFRLAHPDFLPLGHFAEEATELVRPWEAPDKDWPVYGVNNEAGVVFSHFQRGNTFNAPYKHIRKTGSFTTRRARMSVLSGASRMFRPTPLPVPNTKSGASRVNCSPLTLKYLFKPAFSWSRLLAIASAQ